MAAPTIQPPMKKMLMGGFSKSVMITWLIAITTRVIIGNCAPNCWAPNSFGFTSRVVPSLGRLRVQAGEKAVAHRGVNGEG